ncbi:hypothetical protein F2Q69_00063855 [Brassica cretica]|uniref:Uncharacterized protein n=1 Tax=Brassica cretica TaxID=69181 RepID=A0A8S9REF6_BRACR|nr:hypothetical protein F2Q69_00063855 [Brassica cretica]
MILLEPLLGVDVVLIGEDSESRLHEAEGFVVRDEKVAPCGGRRGRVLRWSGVT